MRKTLFTLILSASLIPVMAGPLASKQVSSDAKWLLHFDVDSFRASKIGANVTRELIDHEVEKKLKEAETELGASIHLDIKKFASVTAYGTAFDKGDANGVLLIETGQKVQPVIDSVIQALAKKVPEGEKAPVQAVQKEPYLLYSVGEDLFASVFESELLLLGKSREQVEKARSVLAGKSDNLTTAKTFSSFPAAPAGFFFLAVAEGFNEKANLPPQANVLKMAEGIRLVLGETADSLFANLALRAKDAEVTAQLQQVVQGMVALISLSQPDNQELNELARSLKVSTSENLVTVNLEYSSAKAWEKLKEGKVHIKPNSEKRNE